MRTLQPLPVSQVDLGSVEFYDMNQAGEGLAAFAGEDFANVNTTRNVLQGPATVGYVTTGALPAEVTFMEHHNHTDELVLAADCDLALLIAPTSPPGVTPKAADVQALHVPRGSAVLLPRDVWHSLAFGVDTPGHYYWLSHQIPEPQADMLMDLDEPIRILAPK